jgi:hypothetical protein
VSAGLEVKSGDVMASCGAGGLYFEIRIDGRAVNPIIFADTKDTGVYAPGGGAPLPLPIYGEAPPRLSATLLAAYLDEADNYQGTPYRLGAKPDGTYPPAKFDCASFVGYVLNRAGYPNDMHSGATHTYNKYCIPITAEDAMPGDLVFFHTTYDSPRPLTHVGIYIGGGRMVHSGSPNKISNLSDLYWRQHFYSFARLRA